MKNYTNEKKFTNGTNEKYMSEKYTNEKSIRTKSIRMKKKYTN